MSDEGANAYEEVVVTDGKKILGLWKRMQASRVAK